MVHRLLFVEDDRAQLSLFKEALEEWNAGNHQKKFELETAETYEAALVILAKVRFDGALLDLRLPGGGQLPGEELAALCVSEYGIPAGIISGNPADFDKSKFNGLLEVFDKGDGDAYEKAIRWFGSLSRMMKISRWHTDYDPEIWSFCIFSPCLAAVEDLRGANGN